MDARQSCDGSGSLKIVGGGNISDNGWEYLVKVVEGREGADRWLNKEGTIRVFKVDVGLLQRWVRRS